MCVSLLSLFYSYVTLNKVKDRWSQLCVKGTTGSWGEGWKHCSFLLVPSSALTTFQRRVHLFSLCAGPVICVPRCCIYPCFFSNAVGWGVGPRCQGSTMCMCRWSNKCEETFQLFRSMMSQLFYSARIIQRRRRGEKIIRCGRENTCCCGQGLGKKESRFSVPAGLTCPCQTSACWGAASCPALKVLHLTFLLFPCPKSIPLKPQEESCFTAFFFSLILQVLGHRYPFSLAAHH